MKFGGTSVADASAFENVSRIIGERMESRPVVVVSALSGMTDALIRSFELAQAGETDRALASLLALFERHESIADALLDEDAAKQFITNLRLAEKEISDLFGVVQADSSSLRDELLSFGERLSSALMTAVLRQDGVEAANVDARECILTDNQHGNTS